MSLGYRITSIWEAAPRFHARLNATKKHYRYIIDTNHYQDVFTRKYATHLPGNYDLHAMKEAAALLTGEHDFKSFCENKHMKKSTVRTIFEISFSFENGILTIDFFGNGFLYHMVRILTGTLLEVEGAGFGVDTNVVTLITKEDVKELPCMTKEEVAIAILDTIRKKMK